MNLQNLLGKPINKIETTNKLTEGEINVGSYLESIMYFKDKNDYIVIKESLGDDLLTTGIEAIIIAIISLFIHFAWRKADSDFDLEYCINRIKDKHTNVDTEELKKKLQIKKENYDRLMR